MTIGILECGDVPAELRETFGPYDGMVRRMLGPSRDIQSFDVQRGTLPPVDACSAYILTGSPAGVYDGHDWIGRLIGFLREARGRSRMVGICFGHQAMAVAFGGHAELSASGWGVGLHRYDVKHRAPWMDDAAHIDVPASHQDQVTACPPGARVIAASAFTPFAGLDYGDAISFQFHPEFTAAFCTALIEARRHRYGTLADAAVASHAGSDDCARVAGWIGRFLDGS